MAVQTDSCLLNNFVCTNTLPYAALGWDSFPLDVLSSLEVVALTALWKYDAVSIYDLSLTPWFSSGTYGLANLTGVPITCAPTTSIAYFHWSYLLGKTEMPLFGIPRIRTLASGPRMLTTAFYTHAPMILVSNLWIDFVTL